jgi:hypothetical protein
MQNIVPFRFREAPGGYNHLRLLLLRRLLRQPVDRFLGPAVSEQLAQPVYLKEKQMEVCEICGFALARVTLPNGWTLETCSATGLKHVLANKERLEEWSKMLTKSVSSVGSLPGSKV